MKKFLFYVFLTISIAFGVTFASWVTWSSSCSEIKTMLREGQGISGMCASDGNMYVGYLIFAIIGSAVFVWLVTILLKLLGLQISKK